MGTGEFQRVFFVWVMHLTALIQLRNISNKTHVLYTPTYLTRTAGWMEGGVGLRRVFHERIKCI
jgi:hypothetical protein